MVGVPFTLFSMEESGHFVTLVLRFEFLFSHYDGHSKNAWMDFP